jgi:hypothetical protein
MNMLAPSLDLHAIEKLRQEELEEARAIQAEMLPTESLCVGPVTISHEFQPLAAVGGDFLDYFQLMDGTVGLYLCDVSGKGLPAALYAALSVGTLRGVHKTGTSPSDALATFNRRLLIRGMPRRHAAIQYAVFDSRSRDLRIASAGMPGPFHLCSDGCRALELSGIPPGLFPDTSYETLTVRLSPGDSMLSVPTGSLTRSIGTRNNLESSVCRNSAAANAIYRRRSYWARSFPPFKIFRVDANSMTIWQQRCFFTPAKRCRGVCPHGHVESGQSIP